MKSLFNIILLTNFIGLLAHAQVSETATVSATAVATTPEFAPSSKLSGDFRYRHQETKDNQKEKRRIHRIMFRIGQTFQIQPDLKFAYRLMTGTSNNSANISVADKSANTQGSPRYGIGLDHAFITYNPETDLSLFIGKMPQFFQSAGKNQIILDRDISPEGLGAQYKYTFIEKTLDASLNLASLWVREKYDDSFGEDQTDSFLNVAQLAVSYKFYPDYSANIGLGLFSYTAIKDGKPNDFTVQSSPDFKGNTADLLSNYLYNYEISQKFLELKWAKKPYEVLLFTELIENTAANTNNTANVTGLGLGYDKFSLTYMKQTIKNDAVLALYTNADFASGQTDSRGSIIQAGYKLNKNAVLNYSVFSSEKTVSTFPTKLVVSQLDLTINF